MAHVLVNVHVLRLYTYARDIYPWTCARGMSHMIRERVAKADCRYVYGTFYGN